jgi:Cu(I)/Ag(I) efflux system membrane fusion protein
VKHTGIAVMIILALAAGYAVGRLSVPVARKEPARTETKTQVWTCPMHPEVKLPEPGKCPICDMDLTPMGAGVEEAGERRISMSETAVALADVETAPVEKKFVEAEIRMTGEIDYDETRLKHITARFPGRLDRLYVDYTGIPIRKGDHLVYIYSPELLSAQEELIQAGKANDSATLSAAREKPGGTSDHLTVYSPVSGVVVEKHLSEGGYVRTGTRIYTIADLSRVWVKLDAYESDLEWVRYGQDVEFSTEAHPGYAFRGTITFIPPVMDEKTRTVKVRVIAENAGGRLKPGMFVRATVRPKVAAGGRVMDPRLSGKWISPMHPEVVKDGPGKCDVCGMDLVRAEELGYTAAKDQGVPLVIPASAPLITGKRAVVYVRVPGSERPTFEGRKISLGPRAGDHYTVRSGLKEGELVVVKGNFKIDSALQIEARPSMMSPVESSGGKPQTLCPVMGGKINRDVFVDYKGKRIYFCCPGCDGKFREDPEKYLKQMRDKGVEPEDVPHEHP